jgi:UDPglucose 6-dehydrogenase
MKNNVLIIEKISEKIGLLKQGKCPIYEPDLEDLIKKNIAEKRLNFASDLSENINFSDIIFVCVGTPQNKDGSSDMSQVESVSQEIAKYMKSYKLIVEKSTVPVRTFDWIKRTMKRHVHSGVEFDVASNPEFLKEGNAVHDFLNPDRIVIGIETERAKDLLMNLYNGFKCPVLVVDPATSELIKHASNSFLATKISFINMVSDLCEKTGADIEKVSEGIGLDRRIGREFLKAGAGYGGSCFPKDLRAFINIAKNHGVDFSLLEQVDSINESRSDRLMEKLCKALWVLKNKRITVWGLSFKPDTDDIRESPSLKLIPKILHEGAEVRAYDPVAIPNFRAALGDMKGIRYSENISESLDSSNALVIVTGWKKFMEFPPDEIKSRMETPIVIDGRNIYNPDLMKSFQLEYYSIGRK